MRLTLKRSLVLTALSVAVMGAPAYAQDTITARIPFDFVVNGQPFHAGKYEVTMNAAIGSAEVVSIRSQDGRTFVYTLTTPASGHDPKGSDPALVFTRHETTYALSQVWQSDMTGRELPAS
jgi:hypothetical protein